MKNPSTEKPGSQMPQTLAKSYSGRRRISTDSANSPEFEFWKVRNPSFPQPDLLSADELFVNGVLLPLQLLHLHPNHPSFHDPPEDSQLTAHNSDPEPKLDLGPGPELSNTPRGPLTSSSFGASKRWRDMFKKSDRKNEDCKEKEKEKEKEKKKERKERKGTGGVGGASSAELNIYIWPFSRSRSAGSDGNRPKTTASRKVSSAPCSRSNSAGESKSSSSPSRGGVHLGRSTPVLKVRRGGAAGKSMDPMLMRSQKEGDESGRKKTATASGGRSGGGGGGSKTRASSLNLNLNVPMCVGYRQHLSCRSDGGSATNVVAVGGGQNVSGSGDGGRDGNLFNLRSLLFG